MNLLETITKRASVWAPVALFLSAPAWASALQPVLQDPATPPATPPPVVKEVPKPKPDTSKDEELAKKKRILEEEAKRKEELLRRKQEGVQGKRFPGDDKPTVKPIPVKQGGDPTRGINPKLDVTSSADKAELARREQEQLMQSDPGAKLVIEFGSERFDLGRLMQGDKVQHTFTMQAGGTTPLKIRQVKPSCGCTVGSVDVADAEGNFSPYNYGDPIEPGRSVRVNASMDTTNKKNK
ncbi:MAG TPA: DUF1573 domain-containing protein, partial [Planctomycetota bacterium]|nr:DUF1573 domain-containing protein [Planctomycetota bacterium]